MLETMPAHAPAAKALSLASDREKSDELERQSELQTLRGRALKAIAIAVWAVFAAFLLMALGFDRFAWAAVALSLASACTCTFVLINWGASRQGRLIAGIAVMILPPGLLAIFWSGDIFLNVLIPFLIALPALVTLCDARVMKIATVLAVVQFLALRYISMLKFDEPASELAFLILVFVAEPLGLVIVGVMGNLVGNSVCELVDEVDTAREDSAKQAAELTETTKALEKALKTVETEQREADQAREEAALARREASDSIAQDFERSVNAVTSSVSSTAQMLHKSAHGLKTLAERTGDEALRLVASAETASKKANTVAAGLAELSLSVAEIAAHSGRQAELAATAKRKSSSGGAVIASLSEQSKTMGEATKSIVRVAERTDLLSLNAAIEAASAGNSGRGFTIVAQEVKQLAGQAGAAASQIDEFLNGVRTGTLETERSFRAIDDAIAKLGEVATSISYDVENQRQSANTIEDFAREAARDADEMVDSVKTVADRAMAARRLSDELDRAAQALADNAQNLERSSRRFTENLKAA